MLIVGQNSHQKCFWWFTLKHATKVQCQSDVYFHFKLKFKQIVIWLLLAHRIFLCFLQKVEPMRRHTLCVLHPILLYLVFCSFLLRLERQLHLLENIIFNVNH